MKGDVEEEAPRPRPLSGGIWTLFSWLRRTERSSSDESITSVGSDRTTASFDFLSPLHYKRVNSPRFLPQSPLTETYKKRLQDRNIRRQNDRDLTLRRKYGLYTEEELGYDAFSLPPARKISKDSVTIQIRQRRAASESIIQPRAAYVPGKRRAPLPPTFVTSASLPRNYKRKRPAPKPPVKILENNKENVVVVVNEKLQMSTKNISVKNNVNDNSMKTECKSEKSEKDCSAKEVKLRTEKSFLKQIFDNRKRNSAIDTSHIKVLPSISELDKQAAEIIQLNKLNGRFDTSSDGNWICTNCLRKYNVSVVSCVYCINRNSNSGKKDRNILMSGANICTQTEGILKLSEKNELDEKKKLREMLKEMKDSLPKRPKQHAKKLQENIYNEIPETETPTLRISSTLKDDVKSKKSSDNNSMVGQKKCSNAREMFLTSQPSTSKQMPFNMRVNNDSEVERNSLITKINDDKIETSNIVKNILLDNKKNNVFNKQTSGLPSNSKSKINHNLRCTEENTETSLLLGNQKIASKNEIGLDAEISKNDKTKSIKIVSEKDKNITDTFNNVKVIEILTKKDTSFKPNDNILKSDLRSTKKTENIRLGDVLPVTAVEKTSDLNTPLKISSLLNPLYTPKNGNFNENASIHDKTIKDQLAKEKVNDNFLQKKLEVEQSPTKRSIISSPSQSNDEKRTITTPNEAPSILKTSNLDHHAQRRHLINQLEQSIAKGDEQTAALAAAKLAKLKLACSVLSFSSQIVSGPLLSINTENSNNNFVNKIDDKAQQNVKDTKVIKESIQTGAHSETTHKILNNENKRSVRDEKPIATIFKNADNPQPSTSQQMTDPQIPIDVWIEDKDATRGPILLLVSRESLVGDLKRQAEKSLGLQIRLQRWIIGKTLCTNDNTPLQSLAGPFLTAPFYLCLVESDSNKETIGSEIKSDEINNATETNGINNSGVYTELMKLEQQALVPNAEEFECGVCIERCPISAGVVLRDCIHTFCRECLADVVRHCQEPVVSCPAIACPGALEEREIRALLTPADYEKWLARSLAAAESGTRNTFHCRTRDCTGWAFCEPGVRRFPCPVCKHTNCVPCQAVHEAQTCDQYQTKLREAVSTVQSDQMDAGTQGLIKSLIERGEALECPECQAIITKKWGCDWIKCSGCKTEICWVTKGRRWGPGGKGDTSGGCQCGVDGKRCHPSCSYCH